MISRSESLSLFFFSRFIGFYRNCYEKSLKPPQDKMLKFLSSECVCSFVELINALYTETSPDQSQYLNHQLKYTFKSKHKKIDTINQDAHNFYSQFTKWLAQISVTTELTDLDYEIKKLCLNLIPQFSSSYLNSLKYYATINYLLHDLFKRDEFFASQNENLEYFIQRIMKYNEDKAINNELKSWLTYVFIQNQMNKKKKTFAQTSEIFRAQVQFVLKQIDCHFNYSLLFVPSNLSRISKSGEDSSGACDLVKNLFKCSWIYIVDVLTGFVLNTSLTQLEQTLFFDSLESSAQKQLIQNENLSADLSFELVAFKSCLDCLYQIMSIISNFDSMDKELSQLVFLLEENCFNRNNFNSEFDISLNQLICLDFLFYSSTQLVCNLETPKERAYFFKSNNQILWNNLLETYFFCLNLKTSSNQEDLDLDEPKSESLFEKTLNRFNSKTPNYFKKKQVFFKSVYENLDRLETTKMQQSISLDSSELTTAGFRMTNQQEIIIKNIFLFLTQETSIKQVFNKHELIDILSSRMDFYLNEKLFKSIEKNLDNLWIYSAQMCQFSKRFLQNTSASNRHEHSTFNNLIIDKLDELLTKLIEKFSYSPSGVILPCAPLPPLATRHDQPFCFKPFSLFSMFIIELWLNVYLDYFINVCSTLDENNESLVDISLTKKLISLIQKSFETYLNISSARTYLTTHSVDLITDSSSTDSSSSNLNEFLQIESLLEHSFVNKFSCHDNTTNLLLKSATSVLFTHENDHFKELCLLDEACHFNNLFFLPFKFLMKNKSLNSLLQDTILVTICELVETYSIRIKSSWQSLFSCLDKVNLNEKKFKIKSVSSSKSSSYSSISSISSSSSSSNASSSDLTFKFDSFRLRTSSLIDIFNIYLSLASNSTCILAQGAFDFIKCLSNYLQYSPEIKINSDLAYQDDLIIDYNNNNDLNQLNDEDERFNLITSDYDHLCELSNSNNTNTTIRPFLNCFDKLVCILTSKIGTSLFSQANFKIDYSLKPAQANTNKIAKLNSFELTEDFANLNILLNDYLSQIERKNLFKIFSFLIDSISLRICLAFDELNCVQLALYLDSLLYRLVELKQFVLVGYALVEIIFKNLQSQIDLIELKLENNLKKLKTKLVNEKLFKNVLFLARFMQKRVESAASLLNQLVVESNEDSPLFTSLIKCNLSRLLNLITKCMSRKLAKFDSACDVDLTSLKELFANCFKLDSLSEKLTESIKLFHSISLNEMKNLLKHYKQEDVQYVNLDVVSNEHISTSWKYYTIKKAFSLAREILFYKLSRNDHEELETTMQSEERNFYRDITLKFRSERSVFADQNEVNLTSFVLAFKFHLGLVDLVIYNENDSFLSLLNESYLLSLKLDKLIPFKILITKLFGLQHDSNCLANFIQLTKSTCLGLVNLWLKQRKLNNLDAVDPSDLEVKMSEPQCEPNSYFVYFIHHLTNYYFGLNERAHSFKLEKSYICNFLSDLDASSESQVSKLFKMHQEHNKALMLSLTNTSVDEQETPVINNEMNDFKNRYQIWSIEIVPLILADLSSLEVYDKNLLIALANLIEVFNSCSPYCQCSTLDHNDENYEKAKQVSLQLMVSIFKIVKSSLQ